MIKRGADLLTKSLRRTFGNFTAAESQFFFAAKSPGCEHNQGCNEEYLAHQILPALKLVCSICSRAASPVEAMPWTLSLKSSGLLAFSSAVSYVIRPC